jgi:hypothetical protein
MSAHEDRCDAVVERVALGEPLGELAEHVASCERCRRLAALPAELGATGHAPDPGLGFAARMTAGAQHRLVVHRRRRIAAGVASAFAAAAVGVVLLARPPSAPPPLAEAPTAQELDTPALDPTQPDPWQSREHAVDDDVRSLVQLADTHRSRKLSASWRRIQAPVQPYQRLLQGDVP